MIQDNEYSTPEQNNAFGFFVLFGMIFVLIARIQEIFAFMTPLRLGLIFQILEITVIIKLANSGKFQFFSLKAPEWKLFSALWVTGLLSTLFSNYKMASLVFLSQSFTVLIFFFVFVVNLIKTFEGHRKVVWCLILAIFFLAVPATYSSGARWTSLGASYDPNDIALIVVITIPFAISLISQTKGIRKIFLIISVLVFIIALFATMSRGGFFGLVVVLAVLLFRSSTLSVFQKVGVAVILVLLFGWLAPDSFKARLASIGSEEDYNVTDKFGRKAIWERNIPIVLQNPVLGVGPGCFTIVNGFTYAEEVGGKSWNMTAHNSYLLIAVEMGLVGLGLYVAFIVRCIMRMQRLQKEAVLNSEFEEHIWFAIALEASLLGYMVSAFFISFTYNPVLYLLVGLGVAYGNIIAAKKLVHNSGQASQIHGKIMSHP